jgi:hypothetical protein
MLSSGQKVKFPELIKFLGLQLFALINTAISLSLNEYGRIIVILFVKTNKFIVRKTSFFVIKQNKVTICIVKIIIILCKSI